MLEKKVQEEDQIKNRLYHEFYYEHKTLFRKDPIEYWREARKYVEKKLRARYPQSKERGSQG